MSVIGYKYSYFPIFDHGKPASHSNSPLDSGKNRLIAREEADYGDTLARFATFISAVTNSKVFESAHILIFLSHFILL